MFTADSSKIKIGQLSKFRQETTQGLDKTWVQIQRTNINSLQSWMHNQPKASVQCLPLLAKEFTILKTEPSHDVLLAEASDPGDQGTLASSYTGQC